VQLARPAALALCRPWPAGRPKELQAMGRSESHVETLGGNHDDAGGGGFLAYADPFRGRPSSALARLVLSAR
jgi:hypothetical protein